MHCFSATKMSALDRFMCSSVHRVYEPSFYFSLCVQDEEESKEPEAISQPIMLESYRALADYKKVNKNEINLRKGDIVEVRIA